MFIKMSFSPSITLSASFFLRININIATTREEYHVGDIVYVMYLYLHHNAQQFAETNSIFQSYTELKHFVNRWHLTARRGVIFMSLIRGLDKFTILVISDNDTNRLYLRQYW